MGAQITITIFSVSISISLSYIYEKNRYIFDCLVWIGLVGSLTTDKSETVKWNMGHGPLWCLYHQGGSGTCPKPRPWRRRRRRRGAEVVGSDVHIRLGVTTAPTLQSPICGQTLPFFCVFLIIKANVYEYSC